MRRRRFPAGRILILLLLIGGAAGALRQGVVPARFNPLPPLNLDDPSPIFVDWRLAALRRDPELCSRVLVAPHIQALPTRDKPLLKGCGWTNSVRVASLGGASLPVDTLSCEAAAALTLWMVHEVQPLATSMLGQRVAAVQHMGTYACRNIVGNPLWKDLRSEHATANAIDIGGFRLEDGSQISVLRDWAGNGREAAFLRAVHDRACRYFRVALGPEFNRSHRDHFHFDRGFLTRCK